MEQCFHQYGNCFSETSYLGHFFTRVVFPLCVLTYFLMKLKWTRKTNLSSSQFVKTANADDSQCIPLLNRIINSENALKEIVKSFIDFANIAKGLMDKNQQLLVKQKLERLFLSTKDAVRGG